MHSNTLWSTNQQILPRTMSRFEVLLSFLLLVTATAAQTLSSGEHVTNFVKRTIENSDVTIFSDSSCHLCDKTKLIMAAFNQEPAIHVEVVVLELDEENEKDRKLIEEELFKITGQDTVPNVFIAGEHVVGGHSKMLQMGYSGELNRQLLDIMSTRYR